MSQRRPQNTTTPSPELLAQTEFHGHCRVVTFENEDKTYRVARFRVPDGTEFHADGNFYGIAIGELCRIRGSWNEHPKYGWRFRVVSVLPERPTTAEGVALFLGSGLIKGIGPATAKKIVAHFGDGALDVLEHAPEKLAEIKGITGAKAAGISKHWAGQKASREAITFFLEHGITTAVARKLIHHYGDNAAAILRTNPYRAGLDVKHIGFAKADELAARFGIAPDSPERILGALAHVLDQATNEGHTYLPGPILLERAVALLRLAPEVVAAAFALAEERSVVRKATIEERTDCYFMPSLFRCEEGVVKMLLHLVQQAKPVFQGDVDGAILAFENRYRFRLAPQQQDAIRAVAAGGLCVVTGGPGTGKTTLVRALLWAMRGSAVKFLLCSPTGRAAQRLSETTGEDAATIHRLLKFNAQTGHFMHNRENPLEVGMLVVDEASMLDIPLAWSLLRAIPAGATVVFVGDVDQLPSVGPGKFLKDLIDSGRAKTTRLQVIFRQAEESYIIRNAHRINAGESLTFPPNGEESDFYFVHREDPAELREALLKMVTERIPKKLGADAIDAIQVLSPRRSGPLGTQELNQLLQERLNPNGETVAQGLPFRVGDKVIQVANNYDLDVFNGDVGRILNINRETREVRVNFGRRTVAYGFDSLDELELAYAITIHKSQGSEYPAVVVIMTMSHYIMLRRNLLYTGVTRGKKLVVVMGVKRALYQAIRTASEADRMTALRAWLTRPPEKKDLFE